MDTVVKELDSRIEKINRAIIVKGYLSSQELLTLLESLKDIRKCIKELNYED